MYGRQVSKNVLASGVKKLSGASGVQKFLGVRCPKLFGSQVSGRQVSKMKLGVKCLGVVSPGVRCLSNSRVSGVQKWVGHQVSIKPLGFNCPKSGLGVKSQCVRSP